jgi:rod shape-determining protein MreC
MDTFLNRYRNVSALVLLVLAQLILLGVQTRRGEDASLIRVWAVTAVTPLARTLEGFRGATGGFFSNYVFLAGAQRENQQLKKDLDRLKLENQYLKEELSTAERVQALAAFQRRSPAKMVAARVIGSGSGSNSSVWLVDRGSASGVQKGMPVVTPDGLVGKVINAQPFSAQVLMINDPTFSAGVISEKTRVQGILRGGGKAAPTVQYVSNDEKLEAGERLYTSGLDRVFPKGIPVAAITSARQGRTFQDIVVTATGMRKGIEEVLVVLESIHQQVTPQQEETQDQNSQLLALPPEELREASVPEQEKAGLVTEADKIKERYRRIGSATKHPWGAGGVPSFNVPVADPTASEVRQQATLEAEAQAQRRASRIATAQGRNVPVANPRKPAAEASADGASSVVTPEGFNPTEPRPAGVRPASPAPSTTPPSTPANVAPKPPQP